MWGSLNGHSATFADWNEPGQASKRPVLLLASGVEMPVNDSEVVQTLHTLWHPVNDKISNCSAVLYMHSDVRSGWVSIPCNRTYLSHSLCSDNLLVKNNVSTMISSGHTASCKPNYIMFRHYCYKVTFNSSIPLPLTRRDAHAASNLCDPFHHLSNQQHIDFLKTLDQYLFYSVPSVLLVFGLGRENRSCIVSMTCSPMDSQHWTEVEELSACNASLAQLIIEPPSIYVSEKCPMGTYKCKSGTCISEVHHCDGDIDCEDGSDGNNCTTTCQLNRHIFKQFHLRNCSCSNLHYQCHSGGCIAADYLCDYTNHCADASDELYCNYQPCIRETEFHSGQGQCISKVCVCDIVINCKNGKDEDLDICLNGLCNGHRCLSGECIPKIWVNDLVPDCLGPVMDDEPEIY